MAIKKCSSHALLNRKFWRTIARNMVAGQNGTKRHDHFGKLCKFKPKKCYVKPHFSGSFCVVMCGSFFLIAPGHPVVSFFGGSLFVVGLLTGGVTSIMFIVSIFRPANKKPLPNWKMRLTKNGKFPVYLLTQDERLFLKPKSLAWQLSRCSGRVLISWSTRTMMHTVIRLGI